MEGWIAVTDRQWYERLLADGITDGEVNFWQPSARPPKRMPAGTPFFFKLKAPANAICGFGCFMGFTVLPEWLAWDTFGRGNGVASLAQMRERLAKIRSGAKIAKRSEIGCCLIAGAEVWPQERWIPQPADWGPRTQVGATYDLRFGEGRRIWTEVQQHSDINKNAGWPAYRDDQARYGTPTLITPRLGQGIFRVAVLDAYDRACAVTNEHSLPVLDTAHIRPYADGGEHHLDNGLPLRVDLHRLFDSGYVTFDAERRLVVSRRLREEFENGKTYYAMQGQVLRSAKAKAAPDQALAWHREHVFRG